VSGKFKFSGKAEITHLSTRKDGGDEDRVLAADVKLRLANVPLADVLCFDEKLGEFLFLEGGAVRNCNLGPLSIIATLRNYSMQIAGRSSNVGVELKKISLAPKDSEVFTVALTVSFQPEADEIAVLAEYLQDEIDLTLAPTDGELNLGAGDEN
jgi:hypothetical protein